LIVGTIGGTFALGFVWDEAKRDSNLAKHGLDLLDARQLFDGRPLVTYGSPRYDEMRRVSVGALGAQMVSVVWVERDGMTRFISLRRARHGETRAYRALHG
jgi:uncharacterized DUF497 family protein